MSIEVELNGKAGRICKHALEGTIHCPLIVRLSVGAHNQPPLGASKTGHS